MNNRIRELRKNILNMDQKEFSEFLGISQSGLSDIERGRRGLSASVVEKLAQYALNDNRIDIVWLFTGKRSAALSERETKLLLLFNQLDKRGQDTVETVIKHELQYNKKESR